MAGREDAKPPRVEGILLDYTHNGLFVIASLAIALMAGFAGLSLTRGASRMAPTMRKVVVTGSAIILGWGIWSMHFVAMLGLQLPVMFFYDPLITLISALIAILMTGAALLVVHFGQRTLRKRILAGVILGIGIPAMHYTGMSGMQICQPVYSAFGIIVALAASIGLSVMSFLISYGERRAKNILLGTLGFAVAVFAVHFIAMAGTGFILVLGPTPTGPALSNELLAFGVALSVFVLSGAFLLTGATFAVEQAAEMEPTVPDPVSSDIQRIPYEANAKTHFIDTSSVAAIRAEGHYTVLYAGDDKLFCPWSITEAENRIADEAFVRAHRSYLLNASHVTSFERKKDNGVCYFENTPSLGKVPVARSRLTEVREKLNM